MAYDGIANKFKKGKYDIGLLEYQENAWLSAIKEYGIDIMNKSLLSNSQKQALINIAKTC
jgi:hypothetical protein